MRRWLSATVVVLAFAMAACSRSGDTPASTPAGGETDAGGSVLGQIRLDAAGKLKTDAFKVELKSLKAAAWDGCMGVKEPGKACAELLGGGYIAIFEGAGKQLRYHVMGARWVGPVDPAKADDGTAPPAEIAPDLLEALVRYARHDWSLRTRTNPTSLLIEAVVPATADPNAIDSYVRMTTKGTTQWYRVGASGIAQVTAPDASSLPPTAPAAEATEKAIREDLASKGNGYISDVSVLSYRLVTWPTACLGIEKPGQMCAQSLVPGFLARVAAGDKVYRYHGAGDTFTNASIQPGVVITNPGPR